jgi:hypothetical protein
MWWESDSGVFYVYYDDGDSIQWVQAAASPVDTTAFLLKSGGTMAGTLALAANPVNPLDAAPKQYVDAQIGLTFTPNAGRLVTASSIQIQFLPINGDYIKINGIIYNVPSGGINAANTGVYINGVVGNLAASTTYRVYVFNNAGVLTIDFSTTGQAISTTPGNVGVVIKSGDDTRSLVGMIRTNSSSQFVDGGTQRFTLSWFNQLDKLFNLGIGNSSTTSSTLVPIVASAFGEMLSWAAQSSYMRMEGQCGMTGTYGQVGVQVDSSTWIGNPTYIYQTTFNVPTSTGGWATLSEGYHTYTGVHAAASGSGTMSSFNNNISGMVRG